MSFRKDFAWGVATASYQIEGATAEGGRGLSVWDTFCKESGKIYENQNGNISCDHYHHFREDIAIMKQLGIKAYRFSLSWTRILPAGTGKVNPEGISFYNNIINCLLENNITPYITLFHWDYPYELYKKGGWLNRDSVEWYAEYARVVVEKFSDRVTNFITHNEPQCFIGLGHITGGHAPGLKLSPKDGLLAGHHILLAHGAAVRVMREAAKQDIEIGYAPTFSGHFPDSESAEDIEAARIAYTSCSDLPLWYWNMPWFSDPVLLGEYPEDGLKKYRGFLPEITKEDLKLIHQPIDFLGQNIYNGHRIKMGGNGKPEVVKRGDGFPLTAMKWPITPECLYWGPRFLYERYNKPIVITENGMSNADVVSLDGKVHDSQRIDFLNRYLLQLKKAADDGVDIKGYFSWTFTDNFEWSEGYKERFGLVYIDFRDQKRIIKDSGHWYKSVITSNGENL